MIQVTDYGMNPHLSSVMSLAVRRVIQCRTVTLTQAVEGEGLGRWAAGLHSEQQQVEIHLPEQCTLATHNTAHIAAVATP